MRKVLIAIALTLLLVTAVLASVTGCGSDGGTAVTTAATQATQPSTDTSSAPAQAATVTITDQAGRQVTIPSEIKTVFCTSPMGTNLMYMLAPELMAGWNVTPTEIEKAYIPQQYWNYVGLGGWFGKGTTGNVEEIIKRAPSIVLSVGTHDASAADEADRIQGLLNIPVVVVGGTLEESGPALRYIGKLLHIEARAEELAAYCDGVINEAKANAAKLTDAQKVKVYYAEGMEGLNTDAAGSEHTEVLELVGGLNVAQVQEESEYGMAPVSLEQVLNWDPQVILVASDKDQESTAYEQVTTGDQWKSVTAVKDGKVYQIPRGPFDWFDRPPSISRILGVRWLGNLLYPDLYQYDIAAEVTKFYKLFYHIDLTQEQLDTLLNHATAATAAAPAK
jgi:iron complex transport system substrate-binding protein